MASTDNNADTATDTSAAGRTPTKPAVVKAYDPPTISIFFTDTLKLPKL
jgi:hypothetical protein